MAYNSVRNFTVSLVLKHIRKCVKYIIDETEHYSHFCFLFIVQLDCKKYAMNFIMGEYFEINEKSNIWIQT